MPIPALTLSTPIYDEDDFTYFVKADDSVKEVIKSLAEESGLSLDRFDGWEGEMELKNEKQQAHGRAEVVKCYAGAWWSITLRSGKPGRVGVRYKKIPSDVRKALKDNDWIPPSLNDENRLIFAAGQRELSEAIFHALPRQTPRHGLVVIAGTTGCSKSTVARDLMWRVLSETESVKRRAHLLTLEDPIEKMLVQTPADAHSWGIDYTPRSLGRVRADGSGQPVGDCRNLGEGLRNALRMTPSALYIGETRDPQDWRDVVKFAGTGHFVLTTTHAGSLNETFENILRAVEARTAADRAAVADKLIAVVHLVCVPIHLDWPKNIGKVDLSVTLPQVWRRTTGSAAALVVDGLSSVQPVRIDLDTAGAEECCFARVSFVRPLLTKSWKDPGLSENQISDAERQVLKYELSCV